MHGEGIVDEVVGDVDNHLCALVHLDGGAGKQHRSHQRHLVALEQYVIEGVADKASRAGLVAPDEKTYEYVKGRNYAPKGADWDKALAWWKSLATDPGAKFDKSIVINAADVPPTVTWGTSPEDTVAIGGVVPAPESFADPAK